MVQHDVISRAKGNIALSKLIPTGEYLDLVDAGNVTQNPTRYRARALNAAEIIRQYRQCPIVRQACHESTALQDILDNLDFEHNAGPLARSSAKASC